MSSPDLLLVTIDSTGGWPNSIRRLAAAFTDAGARVEIAGTGPVPRVRTYMLTDLTEAWLARRATERAIATHAPGAVVYCSMLAALLWPRPGAVWLDALAAENRPGRHGVWQRAVERRRLRQAPVVMTMSPRALDVIGGPPAGVRPVVAGATIDPSGPLTPPGARDIDVVAYAGNPEKKRLPFLLETWARARRPGERLLVAGLQQLPAAADGVDGVENAGRLPVPEFRALLRRARVFLHAPVFEDYGIAPLEALADGCQLVTTPAPGPYPALDLARALDPRLVAGDLAGPLRTALDRPLSGYAERAAELLVPFGHAAVTETLRRDVLPTLVPRWDAT